jgi:hypothetical protein
VDDFIWRFKFGSFIQNVFASVTNDTLRHYIPLLLLKERIGHIYRLLPFKRQALQRQLPKGELTIKLCKQQLIGEAN